MNVEESFEEFRVQSANLKKRMKRFMVLKLKT